MESVPFSPSGIPDFSCVKDFEDEADARIECDDVEPSLPVDMDNLPPESKEFEALYERLQEMQKAPRKQTESPKIEKADGEEDEPLKALYFVRLPKPDFDSPAYDLLQQDFEAQLAQVKIYVEHRRVHTLKKKEARTDTTRALECLKEANARVNEQTKKLNPYKEQRDEDRKARGALKDSRKTLAASTEEELDQLIKRAEFRIEHETISLAEEKDLHNQIKRLKASRPRVREHEQKDAALSASMSRRALSPSDKEHLEKELKEYRAEQGMYEKMFHDLRDRERKISEELTQICSQLDIAGKKKDAIYAKLSDARQRRRMRKNEWQRNRDFSKQIRSLIDEKRIEEAQEQCMEQTNSLMSLITGNEEYRKEYLALWSTKRINPMAVFEDPTTGKTKTVASKPVKKKSALHGNIPILPGQSIPDAVVADTLREAHASLHGKTTKKTKSEEPPLPVAPQPPVAAKPEIKEKPPAKASVPAKSKRLVAHDDFELPAVIAEMTKESESIVKEEEEKKQEDNEALERQRQERIEAQKKKKAEAKKKKEKEAELKEEKPEPKPKEVVMKPPASPPKKQPAQPKKQTVKARGNEYLVRKSQNPVARSRRKQKSEVERIIDQVKQYPILIASCIVVIILAIVYAIYA